MKERVLEALDTVRKAETILKRPMLGAYKIYRDIILEVVSMQSGVSTDQILEDDRSPSATKARYMNMFMLKRYLNLSVAEISKMLDRRDFSSVLHGIWWIEGKLEQSKEIRDLAETIENVLDSIFEKSMCMNT